MLRNFRGEGLRNFRGGVKKFSWGDKFSKGRLRIFWEGLRFFRESLKFFREVLRFFRED